MPFQYIYFQFFVFEIFFKDLLSTLYTEKFFKRFSISTFYIVNFITKKKSIISKKNLRIKNLDYLVRKYLNDKKNEFKFIK